MPTVGVRRLMIRGMNQVGLAKGKKPMPTTKNTLRVLALMTTETVRTHLAC
jgi:hypothetical protein